MEDEGAVYTVVPSNHLLAAETRAFVDWIAAHFTPLSPWSGRLQAGWKIRTIDETIPAVSATFKRSRSRP
jgi:hypothetical protein